MRWSRIFVIADDITGAAEMAGIASAFGLDVRLLTAMPGCDGVAGADVVVLATDTRAASEAEAVEMTRQVARQLPSGWLVFKKTDSALRGHVMAELGALLDATAYRRVLFVPANPSRGRVVSQGVYYIHDLPLSQTDFSFDPEFPAFTSSMQERFPEAGHLGVMMPDAVSVEDLNRLLDLWDEDVLLAGAADLFAALLRRMGWHEHAASADVRLPASDVLVVCGSTQSRPHEMSFPVVPMPLDLYEGGGSADGWMASAVDAYQASRAAVLSIPHHHLTGRAVAQRLRHIMAETVDGVVRVCRPRHLVIEGGATAFCCLREMGITALDDVCQLAPGVVRMQADNGLAIILKPGSYSWNADNNQPMPMKDLIERLHKEDCSLVVRSANGEVSVYGKKGVRDLIWLLDHEPERLRGATLADKVIGKAAAGLMVNGGVAQVYADVMSRLALPLLEEAGIPYEYGQLVDRIIIPAGDDRCPLEKIVAEAPTSAEVERLLRLHFEEMRKNQHKE